MFDSYGTYLDRSARFDGDEADKLLAIAKLQNSIIETMANAYISVYLVNLADDSFLRISCVSSIASELTGFTSGQAALDYVVDEMLAPESHEDAKVFFNLKALPDKLRDDGVLTLDYNGKTLGWCRGQFIPVRRDKSGKVIEVLYMAQRIQAEKLKEKQLLRLSETDGLSQLLNRTAGEARVNECLAHDEFGMFCLFDIDNFKHCNDTYGHMVGDEVIREVGECMRLFFRESDVLMRLGGDEFAVYMPSLKDKGIGRERVRLLSKHLERIKYGDNRESITVSAGTVFAKDLKCESFEQLYVLADIIMYSNKKEKKHKQAALPSMIPEQVCAAMMVYRADEGEQILFATRELIEMFECSSFEDLMEFTKGTFSSIVHPDDLDRVQNEIDRQIADHNERRVDYVEYRSYTRNGRLMHLRDYGHLVESERFGDVFVVAFAEA